MDGMRCVCDPDVTNVKYDDHGSPDVWNKLRHIGFFP